MSDNREKLEKLIKEKSVPYLGNRSHLDEMLYTASETGHLGEIDSMSVETALRVYAIVNASHNTSDDEIKAIKM